MAGETGMPFLGNISVVFGAGFLQGLVGGQGGGGLLGGSGLVLGFTDGDGWDGSEMRCLCGA